MNEDFNKVFQDIFGTNFSSHIQRNDPKVELAPYILKVKKLEKQVLFLAKQCASLHTRFSSSNFFKNNSDYWIEQSEKE